jgi:AcrR family transcriptional regulator
MSPHAKTAETKQRIVRTAAELFAANGYHGTGIQEVAEAVGLGKGALYYHIKSKEDVLFEISRIHVEGAVSDGERILRRSIDPERKFRELSRALMRSIVDHLPEWTVFNRDFEALTGHRREIVLALRDRYEDIWRAVMQEGVDAGVFVPFAAVLVKAVIGLHNYTYLWVDPSGPMSADELSEAYCDLALKGMLTGRDGAARP